MKIIDIYNFIETKEASKRAEKEFQIWVASEAISKILQAQKKDSQIEKTSR